MGEQGSTHYIELLTCRNTNFDDPDDRLSVIAFYLLIFFFFFHLFILVDFLSFSPVFTRETTFGTPYLFFSIKKVLLKKGPLKGSKSFVLE